jgi:hypothetical protein
MEIIANIRSLSYRHKNDDIKTNVIDTIKNEFSLLYDKSYSSENNDNNNEVNIFTSSDKNGLVLASLAVVLGQVDLLMLIIEQYKQFLKHNNISLNEINEEIKYMLELRNNNNMNSFHLASLNGYIAIIF